MGWFHPSAFPSSIFNNKHLLPKMLTFMTTVLQKPVQSYTLLAQRFTASGPHLMLSVADPPPSWDSSRCWSSSRVCFLHGFGAERIYILQSKWQEYLLTISGNSSFPWSSSLRASSQRNWTLVTLDHWSIWIHYQVTLSKCKQQQTNTAISG